MAELEDPHGPALFAPSDASAYPIGQEIIIVGVCTAMSGRSRTVGGSRPRSFPSSGSVPANRLSWGGLVHSEREARYQLRLARDDPLRQPRAGLVRRPVRSTL